MRIFTKSLLTLVLLCIAGVVNALTTKIVDLDYSKVDPSTFVAPTNLPAGATITLEDGLLKIVNTDTSGNTWDLQPAIADGFSMIKGRIYEVNITYKTTAGGNINITVGTWSDGSVAKYGQAITSSSDFQTVSNTWEATFTGDNNCHVLWQCKSINGTMLIKKVEVFETVHEWSWDYHIDKTGTPSIKLYPDTHAKDATSETGVYEYEVPTKVTFDWDTQFWICANEKVPTGTPVRFTFDYKADKAVSVGPQTFREPEDYVGNVDGQDVAFTTEWQTKTVEVTSPNDNFRCIGLTLTRQASEGVVTYSFRNLKVEIAKDVLEETPVESDPLISDSDPVIAAAKAALLSAVKKAKRVNVDNYTVASVIDMNKAIIAGEKLLNTAGGNAEALAKATNNVLQAIDELQAVPVRGDGVYDLTKEMFLKWNEHSANARAIETLPYSAYDVNKSSGLPYGDGNVNWLCYADLSGYDKLVVIANSGAPRFCFNRTVDNAQDTGDTEGYEKTNFIDIPGKQWGTSFFETVDEDNHRYIIDLKAMTADRGFAHLHSIKGANWNDVYVAGMYLVKGDVALPTYLGANENVLQAAIANGKNADLDNKTKASMKTLNDAIAAGEKLFTEELDPTSTSALVDKMAAAATAINSAVAGLKDRPAPAAEPAVPDGWKSLITNGTLEGEDMSSFFMITKDYTSAQPAVRQDYAGKDDHYAVVLTSKDDPSQDWDTQFFIRSNEVLPGGTKIRLEFDYCATLAGDCDTQAHEEPTNYIHWACCNPNPSFTTEWQHYSWEGTVPTQCNGNPHMDNGNYVGYDDNFHSIAFNLAKNKKATTFYFDNIVFLAEDIQTAVKSVEKAEKAGKGEYFDLQGRRVAKPGKGLYILNGRKVAIK